MWEKLQNEHNSFYGRIAGRMNRQTDMVKPIYKYPLQLSFAGE